MNSSRVFFEHASFQAVNGALQFQRIPGWKIPLQLPPIFHRHWGRGLIAYL
jgi:hypothetical protein